MGVYASLGVAQAFGAFLMGATFAILTYFASQNLHKVSAILLTLFYLLTLFLGCH